MYAKGIFVEQKSYGFQNLVKLGVFVYFFKECLVLHVLSQSLKSEKPEGTSSDLWRTFFVFKYLDNKWYTV